MSEILTHPPARNQQEKRPVLLLGSHRDVIYEPDPDDPSHEECTEALRAAFDKWDDDPRSRTLRDPQARLHTFYPFVQHLPKQYVLQEWACIESYVGEGAPTLEEPRTEPKPAFPPAVPISQLGEEPDDFPWIWHGILMPGAITLFSALWKIGKTTLITHLLRALAADGEFLGRAVRRSHVLYVTEEPKNLWIARRNKLGIGDHVRFIVQPFLAAPTYSTWEQFIHFLSDQLHDISAPNVVVLDTLPRFWPVLNENDAADVNRACAPLRALTQKSALFLNHHIRKGDGQEATASRGSGALPAFADILLEMRRYDASNHACRKRVLTGYGRYPDVPEDLVIELDTQGYRALGDKQQVNANQIAQTIAASLPHEPPGAAYEEIVEQWTDDKVPTKSTILSELNAGYRNGDWQRTGEGKKGSPYRYFRP